MTFATWPACQPTASRMADIRAYYYTTAIRLGDGTVVRPTLATAKAVVDCAHMLFPLPMVVEPGSYRAA